MPRFFGTLLLLVLIVAVLFVTFLSGMYASQSNLNFTFFTKQENSLPYSISPTVSPYMMQPQTVTAPLSGNIAFVADNAVWTINADMTNLRLISDLGENLKVINMSISPNGKLILYGFQETGSEMCRRWHGGRDAGFFIYSLEKNETVTSLSDGLTDDFYTVWSPDSKYVAIWSGRAQDVQDNQIIKVETGKTVLTLAPESNRSISPVVWVPKSDKISVIIDNQLVITDIANQTSEVLAQLVEPTRPTQQGRIPQPPLWSPSGRYVAYYKNEGNLYVLDVSQKKEILISRGKENTKYREIYPETFVSAFSSDDMRLFLLDYSKSKNTIEFEFATEVLRELADFGQTMSISPSQEKIIGLVNNELTVLDTNSNSIKSCKTTLNYRYFKPEREGFDFTSVYTVWSPDGKGILGYKNTGTDGIELLNTDTCEKYDLMVNKRVDEAMWFPL